MATDKQINYYNSLCFTLGQEPEEDFQNLTIKEASKIINELKEMLQAQKDKFEGKDDSCYWY
jgi:hypothetical protein